MAAKAGLTLYLNWLEFIEKQDGESLTSEFLTKLRDLQTEGIVPTTTSEDLEFLFDLYVPPFVNGLEKWKKNPKSGEINTKKDIIIYANWIESLVKLDPNSTGTHIVVSLFNILNGYEFNPTGTFRVDTFLNHIQTTQTKQIENRTKKTKQPYINYPNSNQMRTKEVPNNITIKTNSKPKYNLTLSNLAIGNMLNVISDKLEVIGNRKYVIGDRKEEVSNIEEVMSNLDGIKDSIDIMLDELCTKLEELEDLNHYQDIVSNQITEDGTKWKESNSYLTEEELKNLEDIKKQLQ